MQAAIISQDSLLRLAAALFSVERDALQAASLILGVMHGMPFALFPTFFVTAHSFVLNRQSRVQLIR